MGGGGTLKWSALHRSFIPPPSLPLDCTGEWDAGRSAEGGLQGKGREGKEREDDLSTYLPTYAPAHQDATELTERERKEETKEERKRGRNDETKEEGIKLKSLTSGLAEWDGMVQPGMGG